MIKLAVISDKEYDGNDVDLRCLVVCASLMQSHIIDDLGINYFRGKQREHLVRRDEQWPCHLDRPKRWADCNSQDVFFLLTNQFSF